MSVCKEEFKVRILKRRMEVELVRVTRDVKYKVDSVGERRDPRFVQNWLNSLLPHITTLKNDTKKKEGDSIGKGNDVEEKGKKGEWKIVEVGEVAMHHLYSEFMFFQVTSPPCSISNILFSITKKKK